jgi:hypothetical protein
MTRTFKMVTPEPRRPYEDVDKISCDLCGSEARGEAHHLTRHGDGGSWEGGWDFHDVCVAVSRGFTYPECGESTTEFYDICPDCFRKVLMPFLAERGAMPKIHKSDW